MSAECPCNLFPTRSGQDALLTQDTSHARREGPGDSSLNPCRGQIAPEIPVRKRRGGTGGARGGLQGHAEGLAHPSIRLVARLNENWRVVNDPLQWILQRKKGNPRGKNSGWRDRSFCRTREGLLACIREYCCLPDQSGSSCVYEHRSVSGAALQRVRALPELHYPPTRPGKEAPALAFATDEEPQ